MLTLLSQNQRSMALFESRRPVNLYSYYHDSRHRAGETLSCRYVYHVYAEGQFIYYYGIIGRLQCHPCGSGVSVLPLNINLTCSSRLGVLPSQLERGDVGVALCDKLGRYQLIHSRQNSTIRSPNTAANSGISTQQTL